MFFCLRIDLDYVPWDTPDAKEFGHGEPAMLLRILELARNTGFKFHFFASNRVLRAFPANADAVLNEGHDLDWFCKHPESQTRFQDALGEFAALGHEPLGFALRSAWPPETPPFPGMESLKFISACPGPVPGYLRVFPVEGRAVRDAARTGVSTRSWTDATKTQLREAASRNIGLTVPIRPQVLARIDPKLNHLKEVLDLSLAVGLPIRTLREVFRGPDQT